MSVFEENSKFLDLELRYGELVVSVAQAIFNEFQTSVYYRRTWLQSGKNMKRKMIFDFKASCKDRIEIHSEILSIISCMERIFRNRKKHFSFENG